MIRFKYIDRIPPLLRNRYILTILIFLLWLFLFDSNNLVARFKEVRELKNLKKDREYYLQKIEVDKRKLYELKTDNQKSRKICKGAVQDEKADEDLYIILTPKEDREIKRKNN